MIAIILAVLVPTLVVAVVVLGYVAFPYRGERLPLVPRLGAVLRRAVEALPRLEEETADAVDVPAGDRG